MKIELEDGGAVAVIRSPNGDQGMGVPLGASAILTTAQLAGRLGDAGVSVLMFDADGQADAWHPAWTLWTEPDWDLSLITIEKPGSGYGRRPVGPQASLQSGPPLPVIADLANAVPSMECSVPLPPDTSAMAWWGERRTLRLVALTTRDVDATASHASLAIFDAGPSGLPPGTTGAGVTLRDGRLAGVVAAVDPASNRVHVVLLADALVRLRGLQEALADHAGRVFVEPLIADAHAAVAEPTCLGDDGGPVRIGDVADLGAFGVTPAAVGDRPPYLPYVERDDDEKLRWALLQVAEKPGLLLVVGDEESGRARSCAEAARLIIPDGRLLRPRSQTLAEAAALETRPPDRMLIWLDDLERYGDRAMISVRDAVRRGHRVVATLGRPAFEAMPLEHPDIVGGAQVIVWPTPWSDAERKRLARALDDRSVIDAADRGIAPGVHLVAAARARERVAQASDGSHPARKAFLQLLADWSRTGLPGPLPLAEAEALADLYAPAALDRNDVRDAVRWATESLVSGGPSLVAQDASGGLEASDYLVHENTEPIPDAVWVVAGRSSRYRFHLLPLAERALAAGSYDGARAAFETLADDGDADALFAIAALTPDQPALARHRYEAAAISGHPGAAYQLGLRLEESGNVTEGREWLERAAHSGEPAAALHLAAVLAPDDPAAARRWLERAPVAGCDDPLHLILPDPTHGQPAPRPATDLADTRAAFVRGVREERDDPAASRPWFEVAAAAGDAAAMLHLAVLAQETDVSGARAWLSQAAQLGNATAAALLPLFQVGVLTDGGRVLRADQPLLAMAMTMAGDRLAAALTDGSVSVWDIESGGTFTWAVAGSRVIAMAPSGADTVVTGSADGSVHELDLSSQGLRRVASVPGLSALAVAPGAQLVATVAAHATPAVELRELSSGEPRPSLPLMYEATAVAITHQGEWVVAGCANGSIVAWPRLVSPGPRILSSEGPLVTSLAVARDGSRVISGHGDASLRVWDLDRATLLFPVAVSGVPQSLAVSPGGDWVAVGLDSGNLLFVGLRSGATEAILAAHVGAVTAIAVTPDGGHAISASQDATIRVTDAVTLTTVRPPGEAEGATAAGRWTTSSTLALERAEDLRRATGSPEVYTEHILWGLAQKSTGSASRLLGLLMSPEDADAALAALVHLGTAPVVVTLARPRPEDLLLSTNARAAIAEAQALAPAGAMIREHQLLEGLLSVPRCVAARWLAAQFALTPDAVRELVIAIGDARASPAPEAIEAVYRQAISAMDRSRDDDVRAKLVLGAICERAEDLGRAEHAYAVASDTMDDELSATALVKLGEIRERRGNLDGAAQAFEVSAGCQARRGDRQSQARSLAQVGRIRCQLGEWTGALAAFDAGVATYDSSWGPESRAVVAALLSGRGEALRALGRTAEAIAALNDAVALHRDLGDQLAELNDGVALGELMSELEDHLRSKPDGPGAPVAEADGCALRLDVRRSAATVGEGLDVVVGLAPPSPDGDDDLIVAAGDDELTVMLQAPGFRIESGDSAVLILDPRSGGGLAAARQTATFHLSALAPGHATIAAHVFRSDVLIATLTSEIDVVPSPAPAAAPGTARARRGVARPDVVLEIRTTGLPGQLSSVLDYRLGAERSDLRAALGLAAGEHGEYRSEPLRPGWRERTDGLLSAALSATCAAPYGDARVRLASLGRRLWAEIVPRHLQEDLERLRDAQTLQLVADDDAWAPWELLHDGRTFLGDRFVIGRWPRRLDAVRPSELPLGSVTLAYYDGVEHPERWEGLVTPRGAPAPVTVPRGVLDGETPLQGLHLVRRAARSDEPRRDAPVSVAASARSQGSDNFTSARLNMRRSRPVVSVGFVRDSRPAVSGLEQTWAMSLLESRCSALVGPMWAVQESVDAAFTAHFYERLWTGEALGTAFASARAVARAATPDSIDWRAYVLFGDPMARPYRIVTGAGYAVVERVGAEIDTPIAPGATARFRASLRRRPPAWHEARVIEVAGALDYADLHLDVLTDGVDVTPASPIRLARTPDGDYIGWFTVAAPVAAADAAKDGRLVRVSFSDGDTILHTVSFALRVLDAGRGVPA